MRATPDPEVAHLSTLADTRTMSLGRHVLFGLTLVVAAACAGLGTWQLGRLFDRRERNRLAVTQSRLAMVDLTTAALVGPVGFRRVRIAGRLDLDREFIIRGRLLQGTPGIQIVTPLRLVDRDTAVLVNRGFVPSPDAMSSFGRQRYTEPIETDFEGIAVAVPDAGDGQPFPGPEGETWHRLDRTAMASRLPYPVAPYYVIRTTDSTTADHTIKGHSLPVRLDSPPLDDGPHLSYAVQWFLIGGSALGFGIVFIRRRPPASDVPA